MSYDNPQEQHQRQYLAPQSIETVNNFTNTQEMENHYISNNKQEPREEIVRHFEDATSEGKGPTKLKRRKPLKHYLCCICFPCLPMWARCGCCALLIIVILFLVIIGILIGTFKVPTVDYNGITSSPNNVAPFQKSNNSLAFSINFGAKIGVINNNIESMDFESIKAVAYYPTAPTTPIGGGILYDLHIQAFGTTNFTFPFSINYDPTKDNGFMTLSDIAAKCGLLNGGSAKQDLYIDYDLTPTIRIAGIVISPTIRQSLHFPCPIPQGQLMI